MLYPYLSEALLLLSKKGIEHNLFTSGYRLTQDWIQKHMTSSYLRLFISLNGSCEEINGLSREGRNDSIRAMQLLHAAGKPYCVSWIARADNVYDFPRLVGLANKYGATYISVIGNKERLRDGTISSLMTNEQFSFLTNYIKNYSLTGTKIIIEECYTDLILAVYRRETSCFAGKLGCAVDVAGNFMPCIHQNKKIKRKSISDYFEYINNKTKNQKALDCCKLYYLCQRCVALPNACPLENSQI